MSLAKNGGPGGSTKKPFEKFISLQPDGCWLWIGAKVPTRGLIYGVRNDRGRNRKAHILAYEMYKGPVPNGMELDHLCRNTLCVNPDHLEPVTHRENVLRGTSPGALNAKKLTLLVAIFTQVKNQGGDTANHVELNGKGSITKSKKPPAGRVCE